MTFIIFLQILFIIFLQGKSKCIIQEFRKKLEFLKNTLAKLELPEADEHFPQLTKAQKEHERPNKSFEEFISVLDVVKHKNCLKLTFMPHLVDISSAPANLKMELIELSEDSIMKYLFNFKNDLHDIWKNAIDYCHKLCLGIPKDQLS